MARFDTFVFDLDGTLLDTLPDLVVLTNAALNEQGFPSRTADEIHSFVGNGARALMYQAVPADASPEQAEAAMRRWMELYPVIGNNALWLAFTLYMFLRGTLQLLMTRRLRLIYRKAAA